MADIILPGISENVDVKGIIDKLVKVETKKLDRLEEAKDHLNKEKSAWTNLGNKLRDLQDSAHSLYSFRAPFDDKIAVSSRNDIFSATASRIAEPQSATIRIKQVAQRERILSDPIDRNRTYESATLQVRVGDKEIEIVFPGGRIEDLAHAINKQAGDYLVAKLTRDTENTTVIILEARNTGQKNRIIVTDDETLDFFQTIGLFEEKMGPQFEMRLSADRLIPVDEKMRIGFQEGILTLEPENSAELPTDPLRVKDSILLQIKMRAVDIPDEVVDKEPPQWPELKSIGKVTVKDIEIEGGTPVRSIEVEEEPVEEVPEVVDDAVIGIKNERGETITYTATGLDNEFREYKFRLSDIVEEGEIISGILFQNKNTRRRVEYSDLSIIDEAVREGAVPKHPVQDAKNAVIFIDGVKVERSDNQIDDAIRGVNLEVKKVSDDALSLTVDRDYEKITGAIVGFIGKYNELLQYINDQTRVISTGEISEKNEVGTLSGDITVMGLKSKLQTIMMNPYPTERGRELSLLAQIGISMGAANSNWSDIKKGYLQIDEDRFVEAFQNYSEEIKQLFGSDNNNDTVIDNGVAFNLDTTMKGYTDSRNGIVAYHIRNTDTNIKDQENSIEDWNAHIEDYRRKLERDFTIMQQSLNELEQNQKRLESFSNQFKND
jgi:flagellar hook-associated protein 2